MDVEHGPTVSDHQQKQALKRTYNLLSQIFAREASAIAMARDVLVDLRLSPTWQEDIDIVIGLEIPPRQSFLRDASISGVVERLSRRQEQFAKVGFPHRHIREEVDHFAVSLAYLGQNHVQLDQQDMARDVHRDLLEDLQFWNQAAKDLSPNGLGVIGSFACDLLCWHQEDFGRSDSFEAQMDVRYQKQRREENVDKDSRDLIDDAKLLRKRDTGLKELARFLTTPGRSGLLLTRPWLRRLAQQLELAHGFGSRCHMVEIILQDAAYRSQMQPIVTHLVNELARTRQSLRFKNQGQETNQTRERLRQWQCTSTVLDDLRKGLLD